MLDGGRTLREWTAQYEDPEELVTFLRSLYLLVETDCPFLTAFYWHWPNNHVPIPDKLGAFIGALVLRGLAWRPS